MNDSSWSCAVELTSRFLNKPARLSHLLERLPADLDPGSRRRCQFLLFGVVRNWSLLEASLDSFLKKRPRLGLWASLLVASYELMANPEKGPKIVDHAVGRVGKAFSVSEKSMANAVLRKVAARLEEMQTATPGGPAELAIRYSHPSWLIDRWIAQFGLEDTRRLAAWNQSEPGLYLLPLKRSEGDAVGDPAPWPPYRDASDADWAEVTWALEAGEIYIQNPGARLAPELLARDFSGGRVLDLCAAPGGKSLFLDRILADSASEILSVDLPGPRFERLAENLQQFGSGRVSGLAKDLFDLEEAQLGVFEAVLLDAPCSNSGVLQRKPDAKWRLSPVQISELVELQSRMLAKASTLVSPGGCLAYSTCSVDAEENGSVVERFLGGDSGTGFRLVEGRLSLPWIDGHDGAGAYLLRRDA